MQKKRKKQKPDLAKVRADLERQYANSKGFDTVSDSLDRLCLKLTSISWKAKEEIMDHEIDTMEHHALFWLGVQCNELEGFLREGLKSHSNPSRVIDALVEVVVEDVERVDNHHTAIFGKESGVMPAFRDLLKQISLRSQDPRIPELLSDLNGRLKAPGRQNAKSRKRRM